MCAVCAVCAWWLAQLLVVEGGPKAQKRYRKLLMQRIDWADEPDDDAEEEDEEEDKEEARKRAASEACKLVWEGSVVKAHFRSFRVESKGLEGARRFLKEKGCEHYLDMALRFGEEEEEDDDEDDSDDDDSDEEEEEEAGAGAVAQDGAAGMEVDGA